MPFFFIPGLRLVLTRIRTEISAIRTRIKVLRLIIALMPIKKPDTRPGLFCFVQIYVLPAKRQKTKVWFLLSRSPLGAHGIVEKIIVGQRQSLAERGLRRPAQTGRL